MNIQLVTTLDLRNFLFSSPTAIGIDNSKQSKLTKHRTQIYKGSRSGNFSTPIHITKKNTIASNGTLTCKSQLDLLLNKKILYILIILNVILIIFGFLLVFYKTIFCIKRKLKKKAEKKKF